MVEGSSFFLIINDVIITSIPLFKIINVLNHFMILSTYIMRDKISLVNRNYFGSLKFAFLSLKGHY